MPTLSWPSIAAYCVFGIFVSPSAVAREELSRCKPIIRSCPQLGGLYRMARFRLCHVSLHSKIGRYL